MRVLGVAAHPDDLDFGASGSFARWANEGDSCYYLVCTDGSKGSDDPRMTEAKLARIREEEQRKAGRALGLKGIVFLGHKDTELVADIALKKEIVRQIRKIRPDIVVGMDPTLMYSKKGFVNHTDHRAAGEATIDAVYPMAGNRLIFRELEGEGLRPHKVRRLYLINFDDSNEIIDITRTMDKKLKAISCHKSQISKEDLDQARQMAAVAGRTRGYKFAEGFVKLNFRI